MKVTKRQLKQLIREEIESVMSHQDPNIQKIENIIYSLPNVSRDNFELHIEHDPEYDGGEYTVFHSGYAMEKLASLAGLRMGHEIASMFEDAGFEVGETWSMKEPVVLIDPKAER
jgi:hydrogenase maturation factor